MTEFPTETQGQIIQKSLGAYKTSLAVVGCSSCGHRVRVQVFRDQFGPRRECWAMEWEIQVTQNDFGATSGTGLDLNPDESLMLDTGPKTAAIMAIKPRLRDKESCKSNPLLASSHMLAVIPLHINNFMSLCIFAMTIQRYYSCLSEN